MREKLDPQKETELLFGLCSIQRDQNGNLHEAPESEACDRRQCGSAAEEYISARGVNDRPGKVGPPCGLPEGPATANEHGAVFGWATVAKKLFRSGKSRPSCLP